MAVPIPRMANFLSHEVREWRDEAMTRQGLEEERSVPGMHCAKVTSELPLSNDSAELCDGIGDHYHSTFISQHVSLIAT